MYNGKKILIVEDQFIEANNLQEMLEGAGYAVTGIARSVTTALGMIDQEIPDMVLIDIFLKGTLTGIDLAQQLRLRNIPFIYLSANSNKSTLESAKATRPYGFLVKPFRESDVLMMLGIAQYLHANSLESRAAHNSPPADNLQTKFKGIIGNSEKLHSVLRQLQLVAPTDTSVLILGESGTGKERIAECIHEHSARNGKPLIRINCAALPADLMDSFLFGHERGSFTGAHERRIGKFEQAFEGTLFLDEIGDISQQVQVKLLRVLQEKEIERLGGSEIIRTNVRVIAATSRNLETEVAEGRFRLDLYYRLNVFPLQLPPLRERKEDIPLLADHFARLHAQKAGRHITGIDDNAMAQLQAYHWPGNIRELEHWVERAVLLSQGPVITSFLLQHAAPDTSPQPRIKTMEENEREHIIAALKACDGKIYGQGGAAEMLDMKVSTLNFRIKKLGINKEAVLRS